MNLKESWFYVAAVGLFIYLLVLQTQAIWPFTIDDMYISLRYSKHWVSGIGILWNMNSIPVEGYSNFSFVVLAALALLLHLDPVITLKIAGLLGLISTGVFLYLITRIWFDKKLSLVPVVWLLLYKGQIIWASSGLETAVYESLLVGSVYFCYLGLGYRLFPTSKGDINNRYLFLAGLFLSIAALTRPEAPVFMIVFAALIALEQRPLFSVDNLRRVAVFSAPIICIFVPYFLWRWNYFGKLFPNPVYCKGFDGRAFALDLSYLKLAWPFVLLSIPACFKALDKRLNFLWIPSAVYLLMLIDADTLVAFQNRLFLPAFALLLVLAFQGVSSLVNYLQPNPERAAIYTLMTAVLVAVLFIPKMTLSEYRYFSEAPVNGEKLRISVVNWFNAHANMNDTVVLADSGLIPYYSPLQFIDSYCLNNADMTAISSSNRYDIFCNSILLQKPKYFLLTALIENGKELYTPSDFCLKKILKNNQKYKLANVFSATTSQSQYRYELYVKL